MSFAEARKGILEEIAEVTAAVDGERAGTLVHEILSAEKVFLVGVGRVFLTLQAFDKRLNHLGVKAFCVGDLNEPAISERDLLIAGSGSGASIVPVAIAKLAKSIGARVAYVGSNPESPLCGLADCFVRIPCATKLGLPGEYASKQIMGSLFEQALYIFCDSICLMLAVEKDININAL